MVSNVNVGVHMTRKLGYRCLSSDYVQLMTAATKKSLSGRGLQALPRIKDASSSNLNRLGLIRKKAERVLDRVEHRKKKGELDDSTSYAESVGPRVIIEMIDFMNTLFGKADDSNDAFVMARIFTASSCLITHAGNNLLKEQRYPPDNAVSKSMAKNSIQMAVVTYDDTVNSLCRANENLGIDLPGFPLE